ncbi:phage portal protein family protein [Nesterenkonia flava]|uniref:DUF935 family protein n=1 Tax=Nesterenkonia flava TaxID=469799 RepID=A0ABU1FS23_9MICC|nr:DUF935 family protein [Nesterenkonia flava]MDR5711413.1 DUF935 family protein [Nesterenkonia flava]
MAPTIPTREIGTPGGLTATRNRRTGNTTYEVDPLEENRELRFPQSIPVYDRMRSQDGHIESIISAITLPVLKADWQLTGDVKPEVMALVRDSLGIPAAGEARARNLGYGISWREHVSQCAATLLWAGFMPFEQVYVVDEATGRVHLRKLAPRPPRTITNIEVGQDGGLEAIYQTPVWSPGASLLEEKRITVDRLVMYTHRKEGADWTGRSMLRSSYKHWLIKDVLLRLDAQAAERGSMGIPVVNYDKPEEKQLAEDIAENLRAGATAGVALPQSMKLTIIGVQGNTVDLVPRIRYHDQEIARSALAMFLDITSNENGSRALAEPILEVFMDSVQAFADGIAETATEHIVRDLVRLNFGDEEPYPELVAGDLKAARGIAVDHLKTLVDAGIIRPDDKLEDHQRSQYGLPERDTETTRTPQANQPVPAPSYSDTAVVQDELPGLQDLTEQLKQNTAARRRWYASRQADA